MADETTKKHGIVDRAVAGIVSGIGDVIDDLRRRQLARDAHRALATADRAHALSVIAMLHAAKLRAELAGDHELAGLYGGALLACRDEVERVLAC